MKKVFLLTVAVVLVTVNANAQNRENFWLGGSFGFESAGTSTDCKSFTINPELGYNLSDRWGIGIRAEIRQTGTRSRYLYGDSRIFSVAPFVRCTFLNWNVLNVFADGGFMYSSAGGETDNQGSARPVDKIRHGDIFINPGFSLRLIGPFALTGSTNIFRFGYTNTSRSPHSEIYDTYIWAASLNPPFYLSNFTLGFTFTF
jgi:hypothetical protein